MLTTEKPPLGEAYLSHISMKPWGSYKESDYTPEQWHNACLIHLHEGAPENKALCKLPVRTPNGALNKNGVHSATAALNGARGGLDAPEEQKDKARQALIRMYRELDESPPSSLNHSETDPEALVHFGVKGMKWGQRKKSSSGSSSKMSTRKKVATGLAVAAVGASAIAFVMARRGSVSVSQLRGSTRSARTASSFRPQMARPNFGNLGRSSGPMPSGPARIRGAIPMPGGSRAASATAATGRRATNNISQAEWRRRVSDVLGDMREANAQQDRWMRSQGLGAALNQARS